MSGQAGQQAEKKELSGGLKLLIEAGPLLAFFLVNAKWGIFAGTAVYMVTAAIAMSASWLLIRRVAIMPIIALVFVLAFGGLTIWLHDDTFIKIKVTLINALFGALLLGGMAFGRTWLKLIMGEAIEMDDMGWRKLTLRWGLFFFFLAGLNETVWRSVSTDAWVNFKVFGLLPLTFIFAIAQTPLMQKHMIHPPGGKD
jgi:intracellular septation protein